MFSIIRNSMERCKAYNSNSEIYPDICLERERIIRNQNIKETLGIMSVIALGAFSVFIWLAYEGWITPDMFK